MRNPFKRKKSSPNKGAQASKAKAMDDMSDASLDSRQSEFESGSLQSFLSQPMTMIMTNQILDGLIRQISSEVKGELGYWQCFKEGRTLLVITDETHNRMRIMSPVAAQEDLDKAQLICLLEANFGSALDAKYALRDGTLWSVFTHPLAQLSEDQFMDCAAQVINLANNFGGSYASSNLIFGGG